jgi:hypothetical protein
MTDDGPSIADRQRSLELKSNPQCSQFRRYRSCIDRFQEPRSQFLVHRKAGTNRSLHKIFDFIWQG